MNRVAVITDIHANLPALEATLTDRTILVGPVRKPYAGADAPKVWILASARRIELEERAK